MLFAGLSLSSDACISFRSWRPRKRTSRQEVRTCNQPTGAFSFFPFLDDKEGTGLVRNIHRSKPTVVSRASRRMCVVKGRNNEKPVPGPAVLIKGLSPPDLVSPHSRHSCLSKLNRFVLWRVAVISQFILKQVVPNVAGISGERYENQKNQAETSHSA